METKSKIRRDHSSFPNRNVVTRGSSDIKHLLALVVDLTRPFRLIIKIAPTKLGIDPEHV